MAVTGDERTSILFRFLFRALRCFASI